MCGVDLYWIPLGAGVGGSLVRWSGRAYESISAALARRPRCDLFHSALQIHTDGQVTAIEMTPAWTQHGERGVVSEGPVGSPALGRWKPFRYEVRCWRGGNIPDVAAAVGGAIRVSDDLGVAGRVLDLVPGFPLYTWGRDELGTGDMWNSNSLISWLLGSAGLDLSGIGPPLGGRAPGWNAGLTVLSRPD